MSFGERLKLARITAGMTQKELGELTQINEANIRKYESERQYPKMCNYKKFARAFNIGMNFFEGMSPFEDLDFLNQYKVVILYDLQKKGFMHIPENIPLATVETFDYWKIVHKYISSIEQGKDNNLLIVYKEAQPVSPEEVFFDASQQKDDLYYLFMKLNKKGKEIAIERLKELAKIDEYTI